MNAAHTLPTPRPATRDGEIGRLIDAITAADFFALREPPAVKAAAALRRLGAPAAAALAAVLRRALAAGESTWMPVHRPLYVLESMGPLARAALPELIAAVGSRHGVNALLAARAIGHIGPAARVARPALLRAAERWRGARGVPKSITDALAAIAAARDCRPHMRPA
jgi:hypothetical protein